MKALTVLKPQVAEYQEVPKPAAVGRFMTVKVERAGICATDFSIFSGDCSFVRSGEIVYPVRFGHEWSGTVVECGDEVRGFRPGDRIYSDSGISCGKCPDCLAGHYDKCRFTRSVGTINCWDGCFSEYISIPDYNAYHIPDSVSFDEATLIEPSAISYDAFRNVELNEASTVVVIGTGAIGMSAVWLAKYLGAGRVVVVGRTPSKLEIGRKIGADIAVNSTVTDPVKAIKDLTDGQGAELVIETSGSDKALYQGIYMTRNDCRICSLSFYEHDLDGVPVDHLVLNKISLVGGAGRFGNPQKVCGIFEKNPVKLTPIITHRIKFDEMKDFLESSAKYAKSKIKVMVEF